MLFRCWNQPRKYLVKEVSAFVQNAEKGCRKTELAALPANLTKAEKKQIWKIIEKARRDDDNPYTAQQSIPFQQIESGKQSIDLFVSPNFTVNEAAAEIVMNNASVTEQKVDATETTRMDTATPRVEPPVEDILEKDVPKTDIPVKVPDVPVEDKSLVEIPDKEVPAACIPVADVPQTGDDSGMRYILLMASLAGLVYRTSPTHF